MKRAFCGQSSRLPQSIRFRLVTDADLPFLRDLYASTRMEEMSVVDWQEAQKSAFLTMQFEAQHRYYQEQFSSAEYLVVKQDGKSIGRIYLDRRQDELRLIDIALIPETRNQGVGQCFVTGSSG